MTFTPLKIDGVWLHTPKIWPDDRGTFHEVFKHSLISEQLGREFQVKQVNQSTSAAGVIRGIHWTDSPEGQAKYVSCPKGALWDVVVDLRPESSTFGQWDAQQLSEANGHSLLISEGIGHAFLSLLDGTVANYLCTSEFNPEADKVISPFDASLNISFRETAMLTGISDLRASEKDRYGTSFDQYWKNL
jgi:dTDP-4-dehydrorhamnose 3,5-epimerase